MSSADAVLAAMWIGLTAYVLFGGADFGGGFWDLVAGGTERGADQRRLIEHSIGPVWEANHVWLIFVVVVLWTGFPSVFAAIMSTAYIPLTLAALGIIGRGAAFAFRKASDEPSLQRLFGATFALSSVATPFFLGTVAGAIASGRVPAGIARGDLVSSWWNPTSVATGALAVGVAAYLAAVFLTHDAERNAPALLHVMHTRAVGAGVGVGVLAVAGIAVLRQDAPAVYADLTHGRGLALVALSIASGLTSIVLLVRRHYLAVRVSAGLAVAAMLWAWGVAQYPILLPPVTSVTDAAADPAVLRSLLVVVGAGFVIVVPSLAWLLSLFQREPETSVADR